jgi:hypothetical protein
MIKEYHLVMYKSIKENRNDFSSLKTIIEKVNHKMEICGLKSLQVLSPSEFRYLRLILKH